MLQQTYIDRLITTALEEDIHYIDVTTDNLLDDQHTSEAYYLAKDSGVLCGIEIAKRVFELVGGNFSMDIRIHDGEKVQKGDIIATMTGSTKTLLKGERTALNILQHMSGIATATSRCVELVAGTNAQITDTRKTLPGLRPLQKYAVTVGGGKNHRYNLSDGAMLKDNHIDAYGGITPAVAALRKKIGHMVKIEVEVRTLAELEEALSAGGGLSNPRSSRGRSPTTRSSAAAAAAAPETQRTVLFLCSCVRMRLSSRGVRMAGCCISSRRYCSPSRSM